MNNLMTISGVRGFIDETGTAQLNLEDCARGLGFTTVATSGNAVVRWQRVENYLNDLKFSTSGERPEFIPENIFYRLAMKAKNEAAEKFQAKVADEILPQIRKTGSYTKPMTALEILAAQSQALLEQDRRLNELDNKVTGIREIVALNPNDWRKDTSALVNRMSQKLTGDYSAVRDLRAESYNLLNDRMGVDLQIRLTNKRRRMADEGVCKSKRDRLNALDVIADDKKLIEGYVAIIKDMSIRYGTDVA